MEIENRDWGRPSPVDLVPVVGLFYRLYWMLVARRGARTAAGDWGPAVRSEVERLALTGVVTAGAGVFVVAGADREALKPALLIVLAGLFVHRFAAALGAADRSGW